MSVVLDISKLPTEFRGCMFEDGWEFDAPCVLYHPKKYQRFAIAGNTGGIDHMIEDIALDLALEHPIKDGGLVQECKWRGWNRHGFYRRRKAWHVIIKGHWTMEDYGPHFTIDSRKEIYGLPKSQK